MDVHLNIRPCPQHRTPSSRAFNEWVIKTLSTIEGRVLYYA